MKTFDGYKKQALTDVYALLAGGGHKPLSEFSMAHTHPYLPLTGGTVTGNIILKGGTSTDMTYSGNVHPYIRFDNSDSSQNISLIFTDYNAYRSPAGIKLVGNQGNEWFEAANIYATTFYGALSGNASTASKWATARTLSLTGSITGSVSFDGSGNITLNTTYGTGNITNLDSRYLKRTGDTMSGTLSFSPTDSSDAAPKIYSTVSNGLTSLNFEVSDDADDRFVFKINYYNDTNTTNRERFIIDWNNVISKAPITAPSFNGNATSATKLQTSRLLWGQPFNGTANVSGSLSGVGHIQFSADNSYNIGTTTTEAAHTYTRQVWARHLNASRVYTGDTNLYIGYSNTAQVKFYSGTKQSGDGSNERMTISTNGNVGIGITSPSSKLTVNGVGDDKLPIQLISASRDSTWVYNASFLAPNLTSNHNNAIFIGKAHSTRNSFGLTHMHIGDGSSSNYAAFEVWGVGNVQRWYYDRHSAFLHRTDFASQDSNVSYMSSALQIREHAYGGAQADSWANAPRLSWHWEGRVQTQIGLASNNELYLSKNNFGNAYKLVYETGTWSINILGNANSATNADTLDGVHLNGIFTNLANNGNNVQLTIGGVTKALTINYAKNADTIDGAHLSDIKNWSDRTASAYWKVGWYKVASAQTGTNTEAFLTLDVNAAQSNGHATLFIRKRADSKPYFICIHNNNLNLADFRLYYNGMSMVLYARVPNDWNGRVFRIISEGREGVYDHIWTLYSNMSSTDPNAISAEGENPYINPTYSGRVDQSNSSDKATRLQTSRTLWGQAFDGTGNVDNTLRIRQTTGNYCEGIRIQTSDGAWSTIILGATSDYGTNTNAWSIHRKDDNNFAISRNSSDGINGLVMTSVGMGLGTTAPTHRLDVRGDTKITGSIRDLAIGGGIYWNPYVESTTDGSDSASITVVKSGITGGTTLVLSQMNDANDTIQFQTSTAARLYHNSYPILTTQNTYVSNNKGYINGTEITQVNNADTLDGLHWTAFPTAGAYNSGDFSNFNDRSFIGSIYATAASSPTGSQIWFNTVQIAHRNGEGDGTGYISQIAIGMTDYKNCIWFRGSRTGSWISIITSANISNQSVNYATSAGNADTVDGYHATDGRTFTGNINWASNWNDAWNDGTNNHPWYGFDHRYPNTGAYSTTISDFFGMTIKTANTLRLDFGTLLLNGTSIYSINVASATKLQTARKIWGNSFNGTADISGTIKFNNVTSGLCEGIQWTCGDNDFARIKAGATGSNAGYLEIATADDGNEPIYVRQYTGVFGTLVRTLTLLDGNGNTSLPGTITSIGFRKSGSSDSYVLLGGGSHKALSDFSMAHSHPYLPLSGGTMTGIITSTYASNTWINGVTNAVIKGAYTNYGAILSMPVKGGRVSLSSYPSNDNNIYFGYATTSQISAGTNGFNKQMYWDAANNNLHADVFTGSLAGNASTATNATNADKVDGQHFNWNNNKNDHTYLWAATDNGNAYLVHRASISVNYANSAGSASSATIATKLASSGYANNALSYYQTDQAFDGSATGWAHYIIANHHDGASYYHYTIRLPFWSVPQYRRQTGSTSNVTSWYNFITAENIGSQSVNYATSAGNADTLDGNHASAFATAGHTHNYDNIYSKLGHTHDDRYYTESEVNNLLSNKLNTSNFNWTNLSGKLVAGNEFNIVNDGFNSSMWFNHSPINDRSKTASINGYHFGNGAGGYTSIKASGFIKNGSSSSYVLLGDGGHKAISDFATTNHTHAYLPLSGGTMTGTIKYGEKNYEIIRTGGDNTSYRGGLKYSWSGSTTIALWGKHSSTQFVWHAGTDFSSVDVNGTTTRTYDFQVGRVNGTLEALIGGNKIWHAGNDGSGSGLDADKLDGKHASAFALSSHTHSYLPLAGGTMSADARISYNSDGNLYIGNSSNDGWVYVQDMASQNGTTYWNITQAGSATFKGTVTAPTFSGNATTATTASKLGSSSVGSNTRHFYLNAGTATASTATVGGTAKPMYLKSGVMTAISVTVGSASKPVYLNGGTITACSSSLTDYLPLKGGSLSGDLYITNSATPSIWARYSSSTAIRVCASSSATHIQVGNFAWTANVPLYISGPNTNEGSTLYLKFSTVNASGNIQATHFYENSDIRYKKILKNLSINSNIIATLPLFDFEWIENNAIGTGTSAQAVQQILPNLVSGTNKLTLDYGVLGTIAGITACKELVMQKSELQQLKEKVKQLEDKLRKYENI